MSTFFWADTHFNHEKCIQFCNRPYGCLAEMNEGLIARWNAAVKPKDTIWFLGDFGMSRKVGATLADIFRKLNGNKHLVRGNHDFQNKEVLKLGWSSVSDLSTVKDNGMRAEVCHYPLESWRRSQYGALMLHGHCHGSLRRTIPHRFDVGCDVRFLPIPFEELWETAKTQMREPNDHHGMPD